MDDDVYARAEAWLRSRRDRQLRGSRAWLVLDGALREYVAIGDGASDAETKVRAAPTDPPFDSDAPRGHRCPRQRPVNPSGHTRGTPQQRSWLKTEERPFSDELPEPPHPQPRRP